MFNINIADKKQKTAIITTIGVIVLIVYFQFLLRPRIKSLVNVSSQVTELSRTVGQAKDDIANIPKITKKIKEFETKISYYEKKMPTENEISSVLGELSGFAQSTKVKIVSIVPLEKIEEIEEAGKNSKEETYFEVPIRVEAKSTYHNLGFFINELEMADRFMKISDIQIQANPDTSMLHNVRLLVSTYVLSEGKK